MSISERGLFDILHVRRLLQYLTSPHAGMRLLTADVEAHVSRLQPQFAALDAAPFAALSTTGVVDEVSAAMADGHARARSALLSSARRAAPRSFGHDDLPERRSARFRDARSESPSSSRAKASTQREPRASAARTSVDWPLGGVTAHAQFEARGFNAEDAVPTTDDSMRVTPADVPKVERTELSAATSAGPDRVDFGGMVQRVLRAHQRHRHAGHTSPANPQASKPLPVAAVQSPSSARTLDVAVTQHIEPQVVLPLSTRRESAVMPVAPTVVQRDKTMVAPASRDSEPIVREAVQPRAPTPSRVRPDFIFDAFEERETPDDDGRTLLDRIDDVLREQARRQGVDLT